ncbi:topoisomerase-4 subunit A [Tistlia consotensis]|uniref:DNA topoisomerase 4 subunit A n=1 Tax=Tistlia consotensis USBA 355 TaxID=560819 RepID=A0A1Y6BLS3_9PROT|nr:DNA topoisomerase IV subunit A [Tistlia consotensis]SMF18162.1 DNA topoisomerase IV subunit A [Tistlia consotensis USBA 355]SNR39878.1 topoisomerase-4 subunit A [Tistlia consotensis]
MSPNVPAEAGEVRDVRLVEALSERYLAYALSTIMSRSLPDVRDGLKPVHRRLLFAMRQLRLDPDGGFKKSARVVGDVIGKFHPHGDQSIYDALVRLAQEFSLRYPLIDGQGNFGNVDGDNAAAMRYTEARLTAVAARLLEGIDEDTVDFRPTYDGESEEPIVLPGAFPNLLANGAQGIAVGMATAIPPHNVAELADALIHLLKHPSATIEKLVELVPGPDFPTGGVLVESRQNILEAYRTGKGAFRLRARWEVETIKGGGYRIIVTEVPYQVAKARLIEKIAELLNARKLALLGDIRDESAADIRLVLEPKSRNVEAAVLMESLFRQTDLEVRIPLNLNVLDASNTPKVMDLRQALFAFLEHRHEVLVRRTRHRLGKIAQRLEVLSGYIIAFLNLDEVIRIIREEDEPKAELIRAFELTDNQAEAILNMRLRSLRKLEEMELRREHEALTAEQADLTDLLGDEERRRLTLVAEMQQLKKDFAPSTPLGKRRTELGDVPSDVVVPLEAVIEREPITVLLSAKGWIRALKGHLDDVSEAKHKEGDKGRFSLKAQTTDKLLIFATNGRFYTLGCDKLPGGRGFGEPLRLSIDLPNDQEIVELLVYRGEEARLLVASSDGRGFVVPESEIVAQTKNGKQVLNLAPGAEAAVCRPIAEGDDQVAVIGENRKLLVFPLEQLAEMTRGRGTTLQKYRDGGLADAKTFRLAEGLTWAAGPGRVRTETELTDWLGTRAQAGRLAMRGFAASGKFG